MSITCCKCPKDRNIHPRGVMYLRGDVWVEYCKVHDPASQRALFAAKDVFEGGFELQVKDERGEKVKVHSLKELREAEKKHNIAVAVFTDNDGRADNPPEHMPWAGDISHGKPRVWNRDPAAYVNPSGVSTGNAADPHRDTLVDRPHATHI
jgi:hypothetical protein